jgi:hypothetical protein
MGNEIRYDKWLVQENERLDAFGASFYDTVLTKIWHSKKRVAPAVPFTQHGLMRNFSFTLLPTSDSTAPSTHEIKIL